MKIFGFILLSSLALVSCAPKQANYTQYADPFVGTMATGHTFPGACVPFGLIQTSPCTGAWGWEYCAEYIHTDTIIWGFTQEHLSGTGCVDLGDILVMPTSAKSTRNDYRSRFDAASETAHPGFYSVNLTDPDVKAELTATPHVAYHRYTYNGDIYSMVDSAGFFLDLQHGPSWNEAQYHNHVLESEMNVVDPFTVTGHITTSVWVKKDVYFVIKFSRPINDVVEVPNTHPDEKGKKALFLFDMNGGGQLEAKIALSANSIDGALTNLLAEAPGWNFDELVALADKVWNSYFSRIEIEGSDEQKRNFYTSFYHALIQPNNIADAGQAPYYSTFSCWDTYRAAHPFYTIVMADRVDGMVNSLIEQSEKLGWIPIWGLWGKDNYCMVANHGVSIIAEAYHKGFRGFDAERAFNAIKTTQTVSHRDKSDWEQYMQYGYLASDLTRAESVSSTLESVYDDYAAWDMATLMGKTEDAAYFAKRKDFYKNLFDPETKFMRPRMSDGSWKAPFDPTGVAHEASVGGDYTEGNAWQYTWHVQHDIPGLIELMGGEEFFTSRLDTFFTLELVTDESDVTGLIGQYAHGNEPSHHVAYLYRLAGKPEKTAEKIREIFDTQYKPYPDGLCGNDDCGQMSAWYMLSAMGFYPVDPVGGKYVFGAPQLPKATLHLTNGNTFTIEARNLSKENLYVKSISLNGKPYEKDYIDHQDIISGGQLVFEMTDKP